uniref:Uncharacterized protein n=1 Tax=Mus musculus TaxID=10090 RepID=Q3TY25_MOUSE|nr:unnamed protein product [Mus musculus]
MPNITLSLFLSVRKSNCQNQNSIILSLSEENIKRLRGLFLYFYIVFPYLKVLKRPPLKTHLQLQKSEH